MGYKTPNIDRIAKEGMMFTDSYGEQSCTAGRRPKQSIRLHGLRLSDQIEPMHADYAPTGAINVSNEEE
jgi:hypothetical protein